MDGSNFNLGWEAPKWTPAEDAILKRSYMKIPTRTLADMLGRSMTSINKRANRLGVSNRPSREEIIRSMWGPDHVISEIGRKTHLRVHELVEIAKSMGLDPSQLRRQPLPQNARDMEKKAPPPPRLPWDKATIAWAKAIAPKEQDSPYSEARIIAGEMARLYSEVEA